MCVCVSLWLSISAYAFLYSFSTAQQLYVSTNILLLWSISKKKNAFSLTFSISSLVMVPRVQILFYSTVKVKPGEEIRTRQNQKKNFFFWKIKACTRRREKKRHGRKKTSVILCKINVVKHFRKATK